MNTAIQPSPEFQLNSPNDSQLKDETSASNLINQNDVFRYSPTSKENQQFKDSKNQFNLSTSQLTPPYQQPAKVVGIKQTTTDNLTPLNELKIEKLEEMKVQDLKLYLKKYNLPVSGPKKISLVERLKNYILKNKPIDMNQTGSNIFQSNLQQLTPPNTPMAFDPSNNEHNSDSDDGKYSNTNCLFNGATKIFVNNSHFPTSIPINSIPYTIHQNQIQFQNSQNTANQTNSFALPLTNLQQTPQIHFLSNSIITNSNASQQQINQQISNQLSQQLNTSLTVHHQQLTTIPQAINCTQNASIPTIVTASQITPILLYSRNSIPNSTSTNQQANNQPTSCSDLITESNSPVKSSVKSSIRKNILLKQKKQQEELRKLQLSQQNKQLKAETKEIYPLENCNTDKLINEQEIFTNKVDVEQQNFFENKVDVKNEFELDTNSNVFELLMEVEEINDFMKDTNKDNKENDDLNTEKLDYLKAKEDYSNKTNHLSQINANEIDRIDQTNRIEVLDQLEKLETKNNLEFNDFSNMDSILNYEMDDLEFSNLNTEDNNFADWLNDQENSLANSNNVNTNDVNTSLESTKQNNSKVNQKDFSFSNFKNDENLNFLYDLTEPPSKFESPKNEANQGYFYSSSSYSKQQNFFETTNCNLMDPVLPNYYTDQQSTDCFTEGNDFKSNGYASCDIDMNLDKNNFTVY